MKEKWAYMNQVNDKNHTILIIDDDIKALNSLQMQIRSSYNSIGIKSAQEAIKKIETEASPDLIVCDILMPGMDGFNFLNEMKKNSKYSQIPVIMITGLVNEDYKNKSVKAGAADFLTKPIRKNELLNCINKVLCKQKG